MTESTPAENTDNANPQVVLETGLGRIVIEVYEDRAPKNAAYFLEFVGNGDYDGLLVEQDLVKTDPIPNRWR